MVRLGQWVFEKIMEVKRVLIPYQGYTVTYHGGVGLNHLAEGVFVTFLPFHAVLLHRKALCTATLKQRGHVPPPVGQASTKMILNSPYVFTESLVSMDTSVFYT